VHMCVRGWGGGCKGERMSDRIKQGVDITLEFCGIKYVRL
jgi:hypothetical protein